MNTQQNTTEQQQLDDLVKLIKLAREEGIPMADNDGRNDHQVMLIRSESGRNFLSSHISIISMYLRHRTYTVKLTNLDRL
jgi:hypothetical protein